MKEVASWGRSVGLNVWKDEHLTREKLMVNVMEEDFCVGKFSGANACCMILQWSDTFFGQIQRKMKQDIYINCV
ncbi:hypothetical protein [Clostridium sp. UBA5119]|uniref:hypothetical protein n=1 Tax=Clostridium sp. UBA5119 TaxID=1946366 RepID=UPI003217EC47